MIVIKQCSFALIILFLCIFFTSDLQFTHAQKKDGATKGETNKTTNKKDPPDTTTKKDGGNAAGKSLDKNQSGGGGLSSGITNSALNNITNTRPPGSTLVGTIVRNGVTYNIYSGAGVGLGGAQGPGFAAVAVQPDSGGNGRATSGNPVSVSTTPACRVGINNIAAVEIFFVSAEVQPATHTPIKTTISQWMSESARSMIALKNQAAFAKFNPYQATKITNSQLEVGKSYVPIVAIRRTYTCLNGDGGSDNESTPSKGTNNHHLPHLLIPTAHAGGNSNSTPQPYAQPGLFHTQPPFGSNGSFPIRARIDVGNNSSYDWTEYVNSVSVPEGQTVYVRLPAFSTTVTGIHALEVQVDLRHSIDPGRTCFAPSIPASAGWGCVRESSETDNNRTSTFTVGAGTGSYRLIPTLDDTTVVAGEPFRFLPFDVTNTGSARLTTYAYTITIGGSEVGRGNQTTNLDPLQRDEVNAPITFNVPNTASVIPMQVCATIATSTPACDNATLTVVSVACQDGTDNDGDGFIDNRDPGCYTNPLDPTTYDPTHADETSLNSTTSPSVSIDFAPVASPVRYGDTATLRYTITSPVPLSCTVTGGGMNTTVTHTPPTTTGTVSTAPVQNLQRFTIGCTATIPGGGTMQFEEMTQVEVVPRAEEV
ncbi:MAG: hypothetical protein RLZZ70_645 [Candidatus Parcubacteria bacterium]|jgi:hypothetical protein